ncbi:O-antigen polymerase [Alteromonas sp. RKMC-009]|uniref:O-antigen polymerase n=1 Tax=Alteromonas sp. RKMC-009 TaxID=2267264 RepID=UPI000E69F638|nr:O-antigen polymerase [Alteromonas sp. RKMC-009]AYA62828.1 oligosaccharide repeat unit polymerase [Alteromonas sp. RKMC-009]
MMERNKVWWLNPISIVGLIHVPILCVAFMLDQSWYKFTASQLKEIDGISFILGIFGFISFTIGAFFSTKFSKPNNNITFRYIFVEKKLEIIVYMMLALYLTANILLFYEFIKNPSYFLMIANAELEQGYGRELAQTIPGITTLSQLGICISVICSYKINFNINRRFYLKVFFLIILISIIRAFVRSERLALIEVIVVFAIPFIILSTKYKNLIKIIPVVAIPGLIVIFSISEYFRSWIHYYSKRYDSFAEFIFDRFSSYFIIAQNSGISYWKAIDVNQVPWLTQQWFYKLPGFNNLNKIYSFEYDKYMSYLKIHLDPQFNNYAPVFAIYTDYGVPIGLIILTILGFITGHFYRTFKFQNGIGIFMYPAWFIGVLELSRTFSWGSTRFFIVFVTFALIYFYCAKRVKQ